jgi:uncharacterized membrane protein YdjX (TVP38/TMEM64 family)
MNKTTKFKKTLFFIWVSIVIILILFFTIRKGLENFIVSTVVGNNYFLSIILYFLVVSITSIFLIPSTPFLIAGTFFFNPIIVFVVGLFAIIISVIFIYFFARYVGLNKYFEKKYPGKIKKIKERFNNKIIFIIIVWSFFPIVPTDLIVYVASTLKISFRKCLIGTVVGEGLLTLLYILLISFIV